MSITFEDARDVVRYIIQHPELLSELRPHVLGTEFVELRDKVRESDTRTSGTLETLQTVVAENSRQISRLGEAVEHNGQQIGRLEGSIHRLEGSIDRLVQAVGAIGEQQALLNGRMGMVEGRLGNMDGKLLELAYSAQADAWFGRWLRRPRRADWDKVSDGLEAGAEAGAISAEQMEDVRRLDILMSGKLKATGDEALLACELSVTINTDDISRAVRRAAILGIVGFRAVPFVGGSAISADAQLQAASTPELIVDLRPGAAQ